MVDPLLNIGYIIFSVLQVDPLLNIGYILVSVLQVDPLINIGYINTNMYKVVISVCLFACPIITQEPLNLLPHFLVWDLGKPMGMFLAWF